MNAPTTTSTLKPSVWLEPHQKLGISLMDHLFNRLDGAYPNRWRAAFPSHQAIANWRETWADAFEEEKITPDQISSGLRVCRRMYDWPPSLTEFIKACNEDYLDIDSLIDDAVRQLQKRQMGEDRWVNPRLYWAAQKVGHFDMMNSSRAELRERFEKAYRSLGNFVDSVPPNRPALPQPGKGVTDSTTAKANLEKLREMMKIATKVMPE